MNDLYTNLTYKILPKNSASPTIMIINKTTNPPTIMKIWDSRNVSETAQGLNYELNTYKNVIKPITKKFKDVPLLPHIGNYTNITVKELGDMLNIKTKDSLFIFHLSFHIFLNNNDVQFRYDKESLDYYLKNNSNNVKSPVNNRINLIILPYIKFNTLHQKITTCSTDMIISYIKQIVKAITFMYKFNLIHNDLHSGNVMIEEDTDDVLLFDWDRSYIKGFPNPQLDSIRCRKDGSGLCYYSQCNIFNEGGYAIDLYKILSYILERSDASYIINKVFKINDRLYDRDRIKRIIKKLTLNNFFMNPITKCTYLQFPDDKMKEIGEYFGTITEIYMKSKDEYKSIPLDSKIYNVYTLICNKTIMITEMFNNKFNFTEVSKPINIDNNKLITSSPIYKMPNNKNIRITPSMIKDIHKLSKKPYMKATYIDLIKIRNYLDYLKYGPIVNGNYKKIKKSDIKPTGIIISDIMNDNNIRKYGKAKKIPISKMR